MPNHVGISHVGISGGMLPASFLFMCGGRVKKSGGITLPIRGMLVLVNEKVYAIQAYIYSPGMTLMYLANSSLCYLYKNTYDCVGKDRFSQETRFKMHGGISLPYKFNILTNGILAIPREYVLKSKGNIRAYGIKRYVLMGDINGITRKSYKVISKLSTQYHGTLKAAGKIVIGFSNRIKCRGTLKAMFSVFMKIKGDLHSSHVIQNYVLKGMVSTIAYVCSVPNRFQEFVTNKRWYR